MQVGIDVKFLYTNFGGRGLSGFGDTATSLTLKQLILCHQERLERHQKRLERHQERLEERLERHQEKLERHQEKSEMMMTVFVCVCE